MKILLILYIYTQAHTVLCPLCSIKYIFLYAYILLRDGHIAVYL